MSERSRCETTIPLLWPDGETMLPRCILKRGHKDSHEFRVIVYRGSEYLKMKEPKASAKVVARALREHAALLEGGSR